MQDVDDEVNGGLCRCDIGSAGDSQSLSGILRLSVDVLAIQLALASVWIQHHSQLRLGFTAPVGLPRLKDNRKRYTKKVVIGAVGSLQSSEEINNITLLDEQTMLDDCQSDVKSSSVNMNQRSLESSLNPEDAEISCSSGIEFSSTNNKLFGMSDGIVRSTSYTTNVFKDDAIHNGILLRSNDLDGVYKDAITDDTTIVENNDSEYVPKTESSEPGQIDSLLLWPFRMAIEVTAFQLHIIAQMFSLAVTLFNFCASFVSVRVRAIMQGKERDTKGSSQNVSMVNDVPAKVTESGNVMLRQAGWGCFLVLYVCIFLGVLMLPTGIMDYAIVSKIVEEPISFDVPLHFDYTLLHPTAILPLHSSKDTLDRHTAGIRLIPMGHNVHITVFLTVPESDHNRDLGMFQLCAELLTETGQAIKISHRPCILQFHSFPVRMLKNFLISLPSLVGIFTESQDLVVDLMEFEQQHAVANFLKILVQPKAGIPPAQGIPEIYSAYVQIKSHLPWLKNTLWRLKWALYLWIGFMLYAFQIIIVLCCCRRALFPKKLITCITEAKAGGTRQLVGKEDNQVDNELEKKGTNNHYPQDEQSPVSRSATDGQQCESSNEGDIRI
ncbi:hypothetical protein KP509_07G032300 [Ceratopteris richardii]|uniref:Seipin n=1 Tax=Ceratopteris richardii TaxID=49495 RepID=A0A8T2UDQ4_CERRI|nr:hypothetical protein KP509_07G032300 [Ceratopteris richardii]